MIVAFLANLPRLAAVLPAVAAALAVSAPSARAATPPNDNREQAAVVPSLPAHEQGTTLGATAEGFEAGSDCGPTAGSVWYSITPKPSGRRVVAQLHAGGHLDAILDVYRARRSQLVNVGCDASDNKGNASLDFAAEPGVRYLVRVAQLPESASASFRLNLLQAAAPARAPGRKLPPEGGRGRLNRILHSSAAWHVHLQAGTTYRVKFSPLRRACMPLALYGPGTTGPFGDFRPLRTLSCGGYFVFTPGPGRTGRYAFRIQSDRSFRSFQPYRLQVAPAGVDDLSPGRPLRNHVTRTGHLNGRHVDIYDLYSFDVTHRSALNLHLAVKGRAAAFDLLLLDDRGHRLACSCLGGRVAPGRIVRRLSRGRYFAAVRAVNLGRGRYALHRSSRAITSSAATIDGSARTESRPGEPVAIQVHVTPHVSGPVRIRIERFDPIQGWQFYRLKEVRAQGGVARLAFRPPTRGRWRARGDFLGTRNAAPSGSRFAHLLVAGPLVE